MSRELSKFLVSTGVPNMCFGTHRSLNKDAPLHRAIERLGAVVSRPVLDGLHHQYWRI